MRDLAELNINEGGEPVRRPPPSDGDIAAFELEFGIKLPAAYLALLRHANGGHPEADSIEPASGEEGYVCSVNAFFHLGADRNRPENLWHEMKTWRPILGHAALPFANDGGGNVFFIDTATNAVRRCIHDEDFAVAAVARSFEDFVDRLFVDPEMI